MFLKLILLYNTEILRKTKRYEEKNMPFTVIFQLFRVYSIIFLVLISSKHVFQIYILSTKSCLLVSFVIFAHNGLKLLTVSMKSAY